MPVSTSCLASAAFLRELKTVSNISTRAESRGSRCEFATDEAYSVIYVPVHNKMTAIGKYSLGMSKFIFVMLFVTRF